MARGATATGGAGHHLSVSARSGNAAEARARGGGIMTWVTWRQHRLEAFWALVFAALLAGCIGYVAIELSAASANCVSSVAFGYCLSGDLFGRIAQSILP